MIQVLTVRDARPYIRWVGRLLSVAVAWHLWGIPGGLFALGIILAGWE